MKPLIIVGQGVNAQQLADKIELFRGKDVLFGSLNRFYYFEEEVLNTIGRSFDYIWYSSPTRYATDKPYLDKAIARGVQIMSSYKGAEEFKFPDNTIRSEFGAGYSSIFAMLCALIDNGYDNIYLAGFDGVAKNESNIYFWQETFTDQFRTRVFSIARDTKAMNEMFWWYVEYALNRTNEDVSIKTVTTSALTCFDTCSIEDIK